MVGAKKLFKKEGRIGIKLDAAKTTEEGYFQNLKSNKDTKLALWLGEKADVVEQHIEKEEY